VRAREGRAPHAHPHVAARCAPELTVAHRPVRSSQPPGRLGAGASLRGARRAAGGPDEPQRLTRFTAALAQARAAGMLRAYHDRSDGGLLVTLLEMAFAGHCGLDIALPAARGTPLAQLFSEEPGVVVQIAAGDEPRFAEVLARHELADAALYL